MRLGSITALVALPWPWPDAEASRRALQQQYPQDRSRAYAALITSAQAISDAIGGCVKPEGAEIESKVVGMQSGAIVTRPAMRTRIACCCTRLRRSGTAIASRLRRRRMGRDEPGQHGGAGRRQRDADDVPQELRRWNVRIGKEHTTGTASASAPAGTALAGLHGA